MPEPQRCIECGNPVVGAVGGGLCPRCCFGLASGPGPEASEDTGAVPPGTPGTAQRLGGYELLEVIGEGGMGVVYRARQTSLNRIVAVKMLRSGSLARPEELKRFQVEAQAVARLKHSNIVRVHEIGEHAGRLFFSMDCIQGRSLAELVGRTPLPPERAARYTRLIAEAVHYAHTQGVLHRDLKPANVLVDEQDQPQITDFGLAKEIAGAEEMTRSGDIMGTPSYMSPEQAAGRRKLIQPASDVYSLGAILYDLLTGRPPFRAASPAETLRQVLEQEPAPLRLLNDKVHRDLETICLKCLAKEPGCRYASAQLLAEDLARFLRREPILARRAGPLLRTCRLAKRHPTLSALAAAGVIMVMLLVQIARFSNQDARASLEMASLMAKGLAHDLDQIGAAVREVADNPALIAAVTTNQTLAKDRQLDRINNPVLRTLKPLIRNWTPGVPWNWLVLGTNAQVLANLTETPEAITLDPKPERDYFQGLMDPAKVARGYYISKPYKSVSDAKLKVGVIAPITNGGRFAGAVARMLPYADLGYRTERSKTVVIGVMDPTSAPTTAPASQYAIVWHPELDPKSAVSIPDGSELSRTLDRVMGAPNGTRIENYTDLVAPRGRWVASLNRVPGTDLVQVYQVRDRVQQAEFLAGILFLPCAVALALWSVRQRRNPDNQ